MVTYPSSKSFQKGSRVADAAVSSSDRLNSPLEARGWSLAPGYESSSSQEDDPQPLQLSSRRVQTLVGLGKELPLITFASPGHQYMDRLRNNKGLRGVMARPVAGAPGFAFQRRRYRGSSRAPTQKVLASYFRLERSHSPIVMETFIRNGLRPTQGPDWSIFWSGPPFPENSHRALRKHQRLNHFPGSRELGEKHRLWGHFAEMARTFGEDAFDFMPETFILPAELDNFVNCFKRKKSLWIMKRSSGACGRGIFLVRDIKDLPLKYSEVWVASRYIEKPLLIQGLKFDLRIYVLVTGFDPLRAYVYREGLVRFASKPYSTDSQHLQDVCRHLTNYSINKDSADFVNNKDISEDHYGHKWSFSALNKHLEFIGLDVNLMWARIMDVIMKTLFTVQPRINETTSKLGARDANCFELFGFDVLIDSDLKPWLIEVNLSPSMQTESPLDRQLKSSLLSDTLNLVGIPRHSSSPTVLRRSSSFTSLATFDRTRPCMSLPARTVKVEVSVSESIARTLNPVVLDSLTPEQSAMLSEVLREMKRCRNFICLYPTSGSVRQYAPIVDLRTPWPSAFGACFRGCQLSSSQLLVAALFGPSPVTWASKAKSTLRGTLSMQSPSEASSLASNGQALYQRGLRESLNQWCGESDTGIEPAYESVSPSSNSSKESYRAQADAFDMHLIRLEEQPIAEDPPIFSSASIMEMCFHGMSMNELILTGNPLSKPGINKLILMEYIARLRTQLSSVTYGRRLELEKSGFFTRLTAFCHHLVTSTVACHSAPAPTGTNIVWNHDNARGIDYYFEEACRKCLSALARSLWDDAVLHIPGNVSCLSVAHLVPSAFAQNGIGKQLLSALQSISDRELESFLSGSGCVADFGKMFHTFAGVSRARVAPRGPLLELSKAMTGLLETDQFSEETNVEFSSYSRRHPEPRLASNGKLQLSPLCCLQK